jgi:hypothetical protein
MIYRIKCFRQVDKYAQPENFLLLQQKFYQPFQLLRAHIFQLFQSTYMVLACKP